MSRKHNKAKVSKSCLHCFILSKVKIVHLFRPKLWKQPILINGFQSRWDWKFVTASVIIVTTRYNFYKLHVCIYSTYACYACMYTINYTLYRLSTNEDNNIPVLMLCILYWLSTRSSYSIMKTIAFRHLLVSKQFWNLITNHASIIPISQWLHCEASIQVIKSKQKNNLFHIFCFD